MRKQRNDKLLSNEEGSIGSGSLPFGLTYNNSALKFSCGFDMATQKTILENKNRPVSNNATKNIITSPDMSPTATKKREYKFMISGSMELFN